MKDMYEKSYIDCYRELTAGAVYKGLLLKGFFAEKLPPIFTADSFYKYCSENSIHRPKDPRKCQYITYENIGYNNVPRILGIPSPFAYESLCYYIREHWPEICAHFKKQTEGQQYKISRIHIRKMRGSDAIFDMTYKTSADRALSPVHQLKIGKRYKVESDISQCFPSIYTHSIAWALATKEVAKSNQGLKYWYNKLDKEVQANKYGETNGLLIGPHASNIVSEIILVCIDAGLRQIPFDFVRCIDDYECYTESREEAERFVVELASQLKAFNLNINRKKTRIIELPTSDDGDWTRSLRNHASTMSHERWSAGQVSAFWDRVLELHAIENNSAVLFYALKLVARVDLSEDARIFYVNQVLHLTFLRPYLFPKLDDCLFDPFNVPVEEIFEISEKMYRIGLKTKSYELLAYSLYYAIRYGFKLKEYDADLICETGDVISITLGNYYARNYNLDETAYKSFIKSCLKEKDQDIPKFCQNWLPCYEYASVGQLKNKGLFSEIKVAQVTFLRKPIDIKVCWDEKWERRFINWKYAWEGRICEQVVGRARKDYVKTRPDKKLLAKFVLYCNCLLANLYLGLLESKNIIIPKSILQDNRMDEVDNAGGVLDVELMTWIIRWFKVNRYIGERCGKDGKYATYYWVKDKLRHEFAQGRAVGFAYLVNSRAKELGCVEVAIRNGRRQEISRDIGDVGARYAKIIKLSNMVNEEHQFTCMPVSEFGRIKFKPQMRAVFNLSSTKYGGRLYPNCNYRGLDYQNIHSELRDTIQIDDAATVEIDYSGLHVNILYAKEGLQCPSDPYEYCGADLRPVAKLAILIMLNAKRHNSVAYQLKSKLEELKDKTGLSKKSVGLLKSLQMVSDWEDFVNDTESHFAPIKKYFYHNAGRWLQREDSELALSVIAHFSKKRVPVLSMHDSFIISTEYENELKKVMRKAYADRYPGFSISVHANR